MLRAAHGQRLANVAAAAKPNGPGKLARIGSVLSSIPLPRSFSYLSGASDIPLIEPQFQPRGKIRHASPVQ
ncbi:MAG: hypothetical protein ACRDQ2_06675 [Gaiellales bacterium]